MFKIVLNFEEAEWPTDDQNASMASCREHACVRESGVHVLKQKSFSLKRAEKGSVTSMKVNDASFLCPPPAPSHRLFITLKGVNLEHPGISLFIRSYCLPSAGFTLTHPC